ncbi:YjfB family protein [Pseudalkalibacillus hwajinpoensis]|uniref:Putative motility protein n=1 Tax=Guptibacillus hwajinpoensis TaxID=208199 RepID=A0A4U1MJ50_9BACL|nr:YjfB family protein [Pseudalkalibacillus hwajinpoensis]TKD70526.1 putative motility protein [Pseudalkalibacillus hwajinpoensis]
MDIAALSMVLNQAKVQQQVNISLTKTAMNQAQDNSNQFVKMLEQSVQPHLGSNINIKG